MEPQHSIPDFLTLVYFTGIKQDFNAHRTIQETTKLEEILLYKQQHIVLYPNTLIIPKIFDVPHATAGSSPLLKSKQSN